MYDLRGLPLVMVTPFRRQEPDPTTMEREARFLAGIFHDHGGICRGLIIRKCTELVPSRELSVN